MKPNDPLDHGAVSVIWRGKNIVKNKMHLKVLTCLVEFRQNHGTEYYTGFDYLVRHTGYERRQVRRSCRYLKRVGLAQYQNGLWSEDGGPAGAGYAATMEGAVALQLMEE